MSKLKDKDIEQTQTFTGLRVAEKHDPNRVIMRLIILRGGSKGRVYQLEEGENLVGRWDPDAGAFPEIDLEAEDAEAKISRRHAVVVRDGNRVFIKDLGSLNGTYLNRGNRIRPDEVIELKSGDEIIVGKTFLRFETGPGQK